MPKATKAREPVRLHKKDVELLDKVHAALTELSGDDLMSGELGCLLAEARGEYHRGELDPPKVDRLVTVVATVEFLVTDPDVNLADVGASGTLRLDTAEGGTICEGDVTESEVVATKEVLRAQEA